MDSVVVWADIELLMLLLEVEELVTDDDDDLAEDVSIEDVEDDGAVGVAP